MKKDGDTILYSPSDLITFVESPFASWMDRYKLEFPESELKPDEDDPANKLLQDKGLEHEDRYLANLKNSGLDVCEIARDGQSIEKTKAAIEQGYSIIYQGHLRLNNFAGLSDFLNKVPVESALGNFSYEIWDTKLSKKPKPYFLIQLCCYAEMLESIQGTLPEFVGVVLGDLQERRFRTIDYYYFYLSLKTEFLQMQQAFDPEQQPTPTANEDFRRWTTLAEKQLKARDHLSQVANIRVTQIKKLTAAGVETMAALANREQRIPGMEEKTLGALRRQAQLQIASSQLEKPKFELIEPAGTDKPLGLALLPPKSALDVFFDLEGYPYAEGGLEYLFGASFYNAAGELQFKDWWAHDHTEERQAFEDFIDWAYERYCADPAMHIYHYAKYEITAMKRLMNRYATREDELDTLLRKKVFVDLYMVVRQGLRVGVPSYSIKKIEKLFRPGRDTSVATAMDSVLYYHNWLCAPDGEDCSSSAMLREIRDYNKDDCDSTAILADWLRSVQEDAGPTFAWVTPQLADAPPSEQQIERRESARLAQELLASLPEDEEQKRLQELLANLLEFHWREAKPVFWAKYERLEMTEEELIEDPNCLGSLIRTQTPKQPEKRSWLYEYSFDPAQETKISIGSKCFFVHDAKARTVVHALDDNKGLVWLKLGPKQAEPPTQISLVPDEFVDGKTIAKSILRTVSQWRITGRLPSALADLLSRSRPRIDGCADGPIITDKDATVGAITAALNLRDSALCIQGPPGTGKTYTAARIIIELLKRRKRVGVTSNSHRAISNLLREVAKVAAAESFSFAGTKVQSESADFELEDTIFTASKNIAEAVDSHNSLIGATAFAFSDETAVDCLDYLFVDEAGQVALANLMGMAPSTKNIVTMGDQMQLGQPTKGAHPGESGQSVLQYLLQEHQTIPTDFGIFLGTTFRMRPEICSFISSAMYESRLHAADQTLQRQLIIPQGVGIAKPAGILYLPIEHEGNSQCSYEEADAIEAVIKELLQCQLDDQGSERLLNPSDILVVAPYNMQVRLLKEKHLKEKVGTVDKFQGQQAPVVIVSMCASDGNESARGLEFLFSKNRLNVALSRAKCLSIVVGHPRLANTQCNSVDQMELVNLYCRIIQEGSAQPLPAKVAAH